MNTLTCTNPELVVKRAMFLAWQACGGPLGMGVLRDNPSADEDRVWQAAYNREDYPGGNKFGDNKPGQVYADYVFGRMMKFGLQWNETSVSFNDYGPLRPDYQAWCRKYPTVTALLQAAVESLSQTQES